METGLDVYAVCQEWRQAAEQVDAAQNGRDEADAIETLIFCQERLTLVPASDVLGVVLKLTIALTLATEGSGWDLVRSATADLASLTPPA